ncbi:hypothetical protein OsJ_17277 [Oryza sativa Japonica Group]|uniref:Neprosin activation peptide domain-containing protein n=1 Tax=Oryza sativa subsp. japonica TaxID=39947 RepID=B9FMP5_ORYSJ|nr:hypothetical protein OsJ_17277 [Oryza sativa Japonica Group]
MSSTLMASCCFIISYKRPRPIIATFVPFLLLLFFFAVVVAASSSSNGTAAALHPGEELLRLERVRAQLARSPDGDVIDCVPSHLQPAFEHPRLRGQKPEEPPSARADGDDEEEEEEEEESRPRRQPRREPGEGGRTARTGCGQAWWHAGEACPEGTIPVRRKTEADMLRARFGGAAGGRFGMKPRGVGVVGGAARRDSTSSGHELCTDITPETQSDSLTLMDLGD